MLQRLVAEAGLKWTSGGRVFRRFGEFGIWIKSIIVPEMNAYCREFSLYTTVPAGRAVELLFSGLT